MSIQVFCLVLLAATLHALWNFAAKKASGNYSVIFIGQIMACVLFFPFLFLFNPSEIFIKESYVFVIATGIIHAAYFFMLAKAYAHYDMSTTYPIARGSGIAGTAIIASILLKEQISFLGIMGIILIVINVIPLGLKEKKDKRKGFYRGIFFALIVGFTIMSYSIVDKIGVAILNPLIYMNGLILISTLTLAPYMFIYKRREMVESWNRMKRYSFIIGVGSISTYLIILFVFKIAKVSYIVAARETSVVIGAFLGFVLLKEYCSLRKIVNIICIVLGMILLKLG